MINMLALLSLYSPVASIIITILENLNFADHMLLRIHPQAQIRMWNANTPRILIISYTTRDTPIFQHGICTTTIERSKPIFLLGTNLHIAETRKARRISRIELRSTAAVCASTNIASLRCREEKFAGCEWRCADEE